MEIPKKCPRCGKKSIVVFYDKVKSEKDSVERFKCTGCGYHYIPGTEFS